MLDQDDKRNFHRMSIDAPVTITVVDSQQNPLQPVVQLTAICRDLSASGMALEATESLEQDTFVEVLLEPTSPLTPSLKAFAKVARCGQQDDSSYTIGLEFLSVS